ncbi:T9SS type A sorting domain-containing protein [Flavobacterium sp.]|uniref:T9SS type A sorting domain-containing protein n=1 Tax=Flavobacterium sp. TaxID=239 RepID=UPI0035B119A9
MKTKLHFTLIVSLIYTIAFSQCWKKVSTGNYHSIGIKNDGSMWSWGWNQYGQLGYGPFGFGSYAKGQVGTSSDWDSVSANEDHSFAIKTDGTLWGWGYNNYGQLGNGNYINQNLPVQIGTSNNWLKVSAGYYFGVAIKTDGTLWAWGRNDLYQLGTGNNTWTTEPVQIGTDNDWMDVDAGGSHCLAIKNDGSLWGWGSNYYGTVGNGLSGFDVDVQSPILINNGVWSKIEAAQIHSMAIKSDGTRWVWGDNYYGELGNGNNSNIIVPTQVDTNTDWQDISSTSRFTMGIKTNGTIWVWGNFNYTPTQIETANDWSFVSAGGYHVLAIKNNDDLYGFYNNTYGQTGSNENTTSIFPPYLNNCPTSLSISENENSKIQFYPNPTTGLINFTEDFSEIKLSTLDGKVIQIFKNQSQIDISNFSKGIYLIELADNNGKIYFDKIIKN